MENSVNNCNQLYIFKRQYRRLDSRDWIKKKATINPKNEDDKCFQQAATVALNYEKIKWNPERVSNIKPFMNKYSWEKINYSSKIDNQKKFKKNNPTIGLNILYTKENILPAYISSHDSSREKTIILLIILLLFQTKKKKAEIILQ